MIVTDGRVDVEENKATLLGARWVEEEIDESATKSHFPLRNEKPCRMLYYGLVAFNRARRSVSS